jgi:O-antigen/teichoic acid export membrane protein
MGKFGRLSLILLVLNAGFVVVGFWVVPAIAADQIEGSILKALCIIVAIGSWVTSMVFTLLATMKKENRWGIIAVTNIAIAIVIVTWAIAFITWR